MSGPPGGRSILVAVLPRVHGRIPRESQCSPWEPPCAASVCSITVLGHLAQRNTTAAPESKTNAKQPQGCWEMRLTIGHIHGLIKVGFCVLGLATRKEVKTATVKGFLVVSQPCLGHGHR